MPCAILDEAETLETFPLIGRVVAGLPHMADEYRFLPVRNYLVFYRVTAAGVFVNRILIQETRLSPIAGIAVTQQDCRFPEGRAAKGDFRTVRQSLYYLCGTTTNETRLNELEKESSLKKGTSCRVGF